MMTKDIIIFGIGGNCIDILETIIQINRCQKEKKYNILGFLDDNEKSYGKEILGKKVLGKLGDSQKFPEAFFVNGIGSENNYYYKDLIINKSKIELDRFETIIHPSAIVSDSARIGFGTVLLPNVVIMNNAELGNHGIILPNTVINHSVKVDDYFIITSGVNISGDICIGINCFIGTGASIKNGISIAPYNLIGMGSCVLSNTQVNSVNFGVPAKFIRTVDVCSRRKKFNV